MVGIPDADLWCCWREGNLMNDAPTTGVDELADVPCRHEAERLLELSRQLRGLLADFLPRLEQRLLKTATYASDAEMAFYELWIRNVRELHDESVKQLAHVKDPSRRRMFYTLWSAERRSLSMLGHAFHIDADLLPAIPALDDPKYHELVSWLTENVAHAAGSPHPIIKTRLDFEGLENLCNELAAQGEPMPPGVQVSPKVTVRVTRKKS